MDWVPATLTDLSDALLEVDGALPLLPNFCLLANLPECGTAPSIIVPERQPFVLTEFSWTPLSSSLELHEGNVFIVQLQDDTQLFATYPSYILVLTAGHSRKVVKKGDACELIDRAHFRQEDFAVYRLDRQTLLLK